MRYQTEIVERLSEGLASVNLETAAEFREAFTLPFPDLESFCLKVAEYYCVTGMRQYVPNFLKTRKLLATGLTCLKQKRYPIYVRR